jgi:hypothetical protein
MIEEIENIMIIPAYFAAINENNRSKFEVDCLIGNDSLGNPVVQRREFDKNLFAGIENPTYLFLGLMHGPGFVRITVADAKEFKDLFIENWGCLDLTADSSDL